MRPDKNATMKTAMRRIKYLHDLSQSDSPVDPSLAIEQMERIAIRFDITLPKYIKRSYCKQCRKLYRNNARIRSKNGTLLVTCLNCGCIRRFKLSR
ncbi:MAG: ribonuclease P Rpr2/Rpp21/SNM1 subunit family protein [Cuniculiplasma sp.]